MDMEVEEVDVEDDTSPLPDTEPVVAPKLPPSLLLSMANGTMKNESPTTETNTASATQAVKVRYRPGPKRYKHLLQPKPEPDVDQSQSQSQSGSPSKVPNTSTNTNTTNTNDCWNESCDRSSMEIVKAPSHVLFYFGISSKREKQSEHRICTVCLGKAESYLQEAIQSLKEKKPVCRIPFKPGTIATIDLEDDSDHEEAADEIIHVPGDFEEQIDSLVKSYGISTQANACTDSLTKDFDELEDSFNKIGKGLDRIGMGFQKEREYYEELVGPQYGIVFLPAIDADHPGKANEESTSNPPIPKPVAIAKPLSKKLFGPRRNSTSDLGKKPRSDAELYEIKHGIPAPKNLLAPTPLIIPRVMPKIGDKVFVMRSSSLNFWVRGEVLEVRSGSTVKFKVKFSVTRSGKPINAKTNPKDIMTETRVMSAKQIAYNLACPFVLPVATRIIALFKDEFSSEASGRGKYYAGIVAEPPKTQNNYRYLVFFDDGYAQYVGQYDVFLVCETSKDVWVDIHPDSQDFIKKYVADYPERPMVRLQKGTVVTTEWNGKWWVARVVEVDCSLVKMYFEADNRSEWIYRGSTRLSPLFNQLNRQGTVRHLSAARYGNKYTIDYGTECIPTKEQPENSKGGNGIHGNRIPPGATFSNSLLEYEGKMQKLPLLANVEGPRPYVPHTCDRTCTRRYNEDDEDLRRVNPLAYPLFLGFTREVGRTPKRDILYRAPCGRVLKDYGDLQEFLTQTDYSLSIEFFCYDFAVDVVHEFVPSGVLHTMPDIAVGREIVKITCVNSIDHEPADYIEYIQGRISSDDVRVNLDEDFLTCCDCTDDCLDKSKCSCWQLTMDGINANPNRNVNLEFGYQNRRLHDSIVTGIYECNQRCKCKQTCSNRVVQNPIRWQLQIFKTSTKGWAIRPLHDIPAGSFLCVYAGQILNDQVANKDGKEYGDEYLAELDYIEVTEMVKEGYEADVIEPGAPRRQNSKDSDDSNCSEDIRNGMSNGKKTAGSKGRSVSISSTSGNTSKGKSSKKKEKRLTTRELFGKDELIYIMDAKGIGNIGRYLNHSCSPNVYVQNVFVDTHDVRFPWVAFFTNKHIRAGTELTWDYNYEIGSVPQKTLYCYCGAPDCRGRLL